MKRASVLILSVLLAGCDTLAYYGQAVHGQLELVRSARPVAEVLEDPATPAKLRAQLQLAGSIRDFAVRTLALPDNDSFRRYVELGRAFPVWNVVSAPEFSVKPVRSCFPVAGCVSYRGFFAREEAERFARARAGEGHDVHSYGVPAYSTLGWFADPLLSSFIGYADAELARLVFHELAHQVVYVTDDTTFNESFAVAVEEEGVLRWLTAQGRVQDLAGFRAAQARKTAFVELVAGTRARLEAVYASKAPVEVTRERKRAEFAAMAARYVALKASWGGFAGYDRLMAAPNNALIASISTYTGQVPGFRRLLADAGGDFARFYDKVRALAALPAAERKAALE
ncbi:MAG TPA: aminopeptidase [Burkholderiales bacterium]